MFTSFGVARRRPVRGTGTRTALFNRLLRVTTVLLALVCAALMAVAVVLG